MKSNENSLLSSQIFYASMDSNEKKLKLSDSAEDFRDKMFTILTFSSPHVGHLAASLFQAACASVGLE